jgi:hypothetical protein
MEMITPALFGIGALGTLAAFLGGRTWRAIAASRRCKAAESAYDEYFKRCYPSRVPR